MMRMVVAAAVAASLWTGAVNAQSMEQKRDSKLAEPWVKAGGWVTDYDVAREKAKAQGTHILAYFSRSYAP